MYRRSAIPAAIEEEAGELDEGCPQQDVSATIVDVPPLTNGYLDLTPGSTQDQIPDLEEVNIDDQGNTTITKLQVPPTKTNTSPAVMLPAQLDAPSEEPWQ